MKRISLNVAKALKAAGYRQRLNDAVILSESYNDEMYEFDPGDTISFQMHINSTFIESYDNIPKSILLECPTYLEVWLWLWRVKEIVIQIEDDVCTAWTKDADVIYQKWYGKSVEDPEEAIISAIEDLVKNNLIK